jgi:hypothetical protein
MAEGNTLTCVFCGTAYPPGTPPSQHQALYEHIKVCPKHPMRAVVMVLTDLYDAVAVEVPQANWGIRLQAAMAVARAVAGVDT